MPMAFAPDPSSENTTRGSRRTLRSLRWRLSRCAVTTSSPSSPTQTTLTCAEPSSLIVTICARAPDSISLRAAAFSIAMETLFGRVGVAVNNAGSALIDRFCSRPAALVMRTGQLRVEDRLTMDVERIPSRSEGERLRPGPVHWVRFFSSSREEPRDRRASDVIIGVTSAVVLVGLGFVVDPQAAFEQALIDLLDALPRALEVFWRAGWGLLVVWVVVVPLTALIQRRPELVRDIIAAGAIAVVLGTCIGILASSQWPGIGQAMGSSGPPPVIPALRLAAAVAVISTSSPHLSRPFRRLGRWLVAIGAFSAAALGITTPLGAIVAVLTGAVGASVVHLVLGSPAGRPGLGDVRAALSELGVPVTTLEPARRQTAGLFVLHATTADGAPIDVKVYGRDAWDTQLVARIWRALWYRELRSAVTLTRLQQAEHEAFVTLLAARHGVDVPEVVTAGRTARQDALLILRHIDRSRGERQVDDATLAQVWHELA